MNDDLYREEILEHYKNPQNFGKLENFDVCSKQLNPFCGDEIEIFIKFTNCRNCKKSRCANRNPHPMWMESIGGIGFIGRGCAISIAAASMLTEYAKEKTKKQLTNFSETDMLSLLGIEISETRKKCALLPLFVLRDCLNRD